MRITVLAGGVGGSRFLVGVRAMEPAPEITAIVNTGDDAWVAGLRIAPDLDTIMYRLAGVNDEERGWGRAGESERVSAELSAWGVGWPWFTLGDLDLGAHIARTAWLREGASLSEATRRLASRWDLGVALLPATDDEQQTWVRLADGESMHFQEWWVRLRAGRPAIGFEARGEARPAPGVLEAIADADAVLLAPSNPVVSIGAILRVPGIAEALRDTAAPVVGVSPIIGGAVVRGMADACLAAIGVETDAAAVALHYGARTRGGVLDGWLVGEEDAASVPAIEAAGIRARAVPLWMRDVERSRALAAAALALAGVAR
ncbi:MAG: 2-phospho-L-lactate transferase [Microbacteriaceae bacterium]